MISKELKKKLKEYELELTSESPLTLTSTSTAAYSQGEVMTGLLAEIQLKEIEKDLREEQGSSSNDLKVLKQLDADTVLLVTADVNYADEFDMSEWTTMRVSDFIELVEKLENYEDEISWYFGSNEEMQFSDGNDLLNNITYKIITTEEADTLDSLFGGSFDGGAGVFDHISELSTNSDDDDESGPLDEESIFSKEELRWAEALKGLGWKIDIHDEDNYQLEFISPDGHRSVAHMGFLEDLFDWHKRNKKK